MNKKKAIVILLMILVVVIVIGLFMFNKGEDTPSIETVQQLEGITEEQFIYLKDFASEYRDNSIVEEKEIDFNDLEDKLEAIDLSEIGLESEVILCGEALDILVAEFSSNSFDKKILTSDETRWDEALTKSEAIEFIINALKSDPSIPTFNAKQGTVEGYEAETEVETVTEDSGIGTSVELEEDEYQGDNPYDQGTSPSAQEAIEDMAQQIIADYLREHAQDTQVDVDVPGGTPASEATEQESNLGKGGELPPELQGSVTQ